MGLGRLKELVEGEMLLAARFGSARPEGVSDSRKPVDWARWLWCAVRAHKGACHAGGLDALAAVPWAGHVTGLACFKGTGIHL